MSEAEGGGNKRRESIQYQKTLQPGKGDNCRTDGEGIGTYTDDEDCLKYVSTFPGNISRSSVYYLLDVCEKQGREATSCWSISVSPKL